MNWEIFIPPNKINVRILNRKGKGIHIYFSPAFIRMYLKKDSKDVLLMWNKEERKIKISYCSSPSSNISKISHNGKSNYASISIALFIKHFKIDNIPFEKELKYSVEPDGDIILLLNG